MCPASDAQAASRDDGRRQPADAYQVPLPDFQPGWVWLAGAGPGDPSLLTLQVAHALGQAETIFYDALVNGDVLRLARPEAERVFVGKRAGIESPKQAEINRRLVEAARAGQRVLRLKGGDPFVFGRGAEEAIGLGQAGVPFRILPGVTSGIGGLAYAGLAVTHRDFNQAVTFVTAHDATGAFAKGLEWESLARSSPVLVVYMGYRLLPQIRDALIAAGRRADTPVAVVSRATTEAQVSVVSTLARVVDEVAAAGLEAPVLIVVGEIVALRSALDWRDGWPDLARDETPSARTA